MTAAEVSEALGLSSLKSRTWAIFKTSAKQGTGLDEAMDWYADILPFKTIEALFIGSPMRERTLRVREKCTEGSPMSLLRVGGGARDEYSAHAGWLTLCKGPNEKSGKRLLIEGLCKPNVSHASGKVPLNLVV
jgi:hypothetical protein